MLKRDVDKGERESEREREMGSVCSACHSRRPSKIYDVSEMPWLTCKKRHLMVSDRAGLRTLGILLLTLAGDEDKLKDATDEVKDANTALQQSGMIYQVEIGGPIGDR